MDPVSRQLHWEHNLYPYSETDLESLVSRIRPELVKHYCIGHCDWVGWAEMRKVA